MLCIKLLYVFREIVGQVSLGSLFHLEKFAQGIRCFPMNLEDD
jgi:hypothetical protein